MSNVVRSKNYQDYYASLYQLDAPGWLAAKKGFLLLRQVCWTNAIELQVVLLPELHELQDYPFKKEHAAVSEFLKANGIEHLDLAPFFKDQAEPARLWVALDSLYPKLSRGGYLIVDDYGALEGCWRAVDDFRARHGISEVIQRIDWTGVYWRREQVSHLH